MKRILINSTHNEEIRVALCKGNHLYDFDLENRTREQKKSNIYKGHVTRVEPSLEAVFVEYGSQRQGFLPIREIANEYLSGNARDENIRKLIKEGDELIVQVEKEERGNKGAALSTYVSLAGRYLVLMPNNPRGGGISRQISGKLREDMKRMLGNLDLPKGMSVIIRTAGIGKTQEDLQHDLNHLLNIWQAIQEQNSKYPSPRLVHQEAGVVTRAVRDYLRDDISEIWIDNENAYIEAAGFIDAVMPKQADKLRKYTDFEPMFARFGIEKQIETAYQREVRLPSGGSIVIDQTEALVSIDINSAKSTKGSDVAETAYHTNLEAADEIARQLRLRDMGGLIVIDFIDMNDNKHQKEVEKRLVDATKYDRARVQFGDISRFGLMEMSRQRLRPSLEESTGYICPRCHGNGMIRDLRSLSLSIMRQIEQIALKERQGEVQAEVPTDIAAFLLNEKRDSLVYLEQDSGTRITILPHAHLESPNFKLHFNRDGFAPSSYERITDMQLQESNELGYDVDWQTADKERPEQQPTRQPRQNNTASSASKANGHANNAQADHRQTQSNQTNSHQAHNNQNNNNQASSAPASSYNQESRVNTVAASAVAPQATANTAPATPAPHAVAWLANLFAPTPQAKTTDSFSSQAAAEAIEAIVNTGAQSLGAQGQIDTRAMAAQAASTTRREQENAPVAATANQSGPTSENDNKDEQDEQDRRRRKSSRKGKTNKPRQRRDKRDDTEQSVNSNDNAAAATASDNDNKPAPNRRSSNSRRDSRGSMPRGETLTPQHTDKANDDAKETSEQNRGNGRNSDRNTDRNAERSGARSHDKNNDRSNDRSNDSNQQREANSSRRPDTERRRNEAHKATSPNEVSLQVNEAPVPHKAKEVVHLSLDDSKAPRNQVTSTEQNGQAVKSSHHNAARHTVSESLPASETTKQPATAVDSAPATANKSGNEADTQVAPVTSEADASTAKDSSVKASTAAASSVKDSSSANSESANTTVDTTAQAKRNEQADTAIQQPSATDTAATAPAQQNTVVAAEAAVKAEATVESEVAAAYDATALFADRYVTAKKFGLASNDPRAVKAKQANGSATPSATTVAASEQKPMPIRGTVGEFIHAALPEAESLLKEQGVIASFIQAVAAAQGTVATPEVATDSSTAVSSEFNFSNYGYAPLDQTYLGRFNSMTQAVRQVAIEQGKTAVNPRPITRRASNDPRGQHPDYQAASRTELDAHKVAASALTSEPKTAEVEQESTALLIEDAEVRQHLEESAEKEASSDATPVVDSSSAAAETQKPEAAPQEAEVAVTETSTTETSTSDDDSSSQQADALATEEQTAEEEQAAPSKTTIASYKNMIENVAEQLLPQQSNMFNLTTPKVPKARSRKAKNEPKKSTQSEQKSQDAVEAPTDSSNEE
jgi:ribonuclease E